MFFGAYFEFFCESLNFFYLSLPNNRIYRVLFATKTFFLGVRLFCENRLIKIDLNVYLPDIIKQKRILFDRIVFFGLLRSYCER